ncbi:glycosyl hydrolase family 95 catalytic domain-containing protein [Curtobacterium ammoniigenes]|uniref:glycosyl hydrolase family 95 catalytic domain-containing protein n=1 Tax=Curtobacterium ammoniigenes TaxID=395387 RepID=UPI00082A82FB|nr:glycoside hydrolase N-terminal domain-containing protein [Curtobacterium ammoniigenes]
MSRLRFEAPASDWLEALPLGDGLLGAMCFGDPLRPRLALNHTTGWSGGPNPSGASATAEHAPPVSVLQPLRDAVTRGDHAEADRLARLFQEGDVATFLPLAELTLVGSEPEVEAEAEAPLDARSAAPMERVLDLATALHTARGAELTHETFVSADSGVLVHRIVGAAQRRRAFRPVLTSPLRVDDQASTADGVRMLLRFPTDADDGVLTWAPDAPSVSAAIAVRLVHGADASLLALAVVTDFDGPLSAPHGRTDELMRAASARVDDALDAGWEALRTAHTTRHRDLWTRTVLDLPVADPSRTVPAAIDRGDPVELTQLQFDVGRYLLITAARPGGLPPSLQGLWNAEIAPPWRSNYTTNINTEMNHWAAAVTGLPECVAPLLDHLEALAVTGAATAERVFGARGWLSHHNSDAWAHTGASGVGEDSPSWSFWPFGGVWLTLTVCDLLDVGLLGGADRTRLARVVAGCVAWVLDWLVEGDDGQLTTRPSTSPENEFPLPDGGLGALASGSTMDLELTRQILERSRELSPHGEDAERVDAALARLPEGLPLTEDGVVREWGDGERSADPHHRHVSHLVGVYPGTRSLTERERSAVARTLEQRGDDSTGWSLMWKACLWARLGRGDKVGDLMALSRRPATAEVGFAHRGGLYPNLFAAHPPFQIDANLAFPAVLAESLMQSHRGRVELLPALPPDLPNGRIRGLVARPGILVDLEWAEGRVVSWDERRLGDPPGLR